MAAPFVALQISQQKKKKIQCAWVCNSLLTYYLFCSILYDFNVRRTQEEKINEPVTSNTYSSNVCILPRPAIGITTIENNSFF